MLLMIFTYFLFYYVQSPSKIPLCTWFCAFLAVGSQSYSGQHQDEAWQEIVAEIRKILKISSSSQKKRSREEEAWLQALLADHRSFMQNCLESFVGRQKELDEIQQQIAEQLPTGGYVTITGQAGQGKSSIIAKLITIYGIDQVAHHFIPINPGPDHQVGLLRNLMARLILKYDLPAFYVASDNRAALRDYFPKVLEAVVAVGGEEIIFIDGLDQLEEDLSGVRDLTFLPTNPPPGILFILGTRPNDTLKPLELLKPRGEYRLPNLSRHDFDLILQHRQVVLQSGMADQFYKLMDENALYLDLVAKELTQNDIITPEEIIKRISANPDNLFFLSLERFKQQPALWEKVIYPALGVLLVAQKSLSLRCIRNILNVEDYRLREGMAKLGGLLTEDGQQRYALFHLKFRDYLRQDEQQQKEYLFSKEEEEHWNSKLADWCEKGSVERIWQDVKDGGEQERRVYARYYYIAHLYYAHRWSNLFLVLDEGSYGSAKEQYDISTRSYIQDLDYGRRAACSGETFEEELNALPYLWRYTLLRCSLRSRVDQYPLELFQLLLVVGREQEALGHAEWLTDLVRKTATFRTIAEHFALQPTRRIESQQLFLRAHQVARSIPGSYEQTGALLKLAKALAQAQQWEQAEPIWKQVEEMVCSIPKSDGPNWALLELAKALTQAQWWEQAEPIWKQAEEMARSIPKSDGPNWALFELAKALVQAQRWEQAEPIWKHAEEVVRSIPESYEQAMALGELARTLAKVQRWEQAEPIWKYAEEAVRSIPESSSQTKALLELARTLAQAQKWEHAEKVAYSITGIYEQYMALGDLARILAQAQRWEHAEKVVCSIPVSSSQAKSLLELARILAQAQRWEHAEEVTHSIIGSYEQANALGELARALVLQW